MKHKVCAEEGRGFAARSSLSHHTQTTALASANLGHSHSLNRSEAQTTGKEPVDLRIGVSVREAARLLGIGRTKTYELMNSGDLVWRKIGRRSVIGLASVRRLIEPEPLEGAE